ncbi:hypothetical protein VOLCADRAFT_92614 [Volvox carteri f. nagariensis]|uniref:SGNH hydrolase-type esterase domain-containing protein n=1 Tax=Volvox carteri f. nagariensis TaxID=3068 RepID=D8U039_VOLCA|nr:uncharacterized protein VOLCADRAFT_92614 [Volvox carteri f. nagariensis]EFJ46870.1 hypothetical protein VOLCADRAFT_92614 [Volvox carteri f. nagariensis]|eukprot:XP_002952079.1 hypothetical protein VOLCADRAFT_92614 [Volvox carteri f. nagariensis]
MEWSCISWGQGVSRRGETDWFSHFSKWMIEAFPRANITARNGCVPGVPSAYMILCLEQSVDHKDVELVFIEFTLNDGYIASVENDRVRDMERLVRRLLALPRRPAVVLMHSPTHGMASYPPGHPRHPGDIYKRFYETLEDVDGAIAQYYDVQMLSVRTALYRLAAFKETDGFRWDQTFFVRGGGLGAPGMWVTRARARTAIGLLLRPFGREDEEAVLEPLPEPMYPALNYYLNLSRSKTGNKVPEVPMCIMYEDFKCVSGCRCDPHREDAHISRPVSQLYVFRLDVSQSEHCDVEVELLPETSSGEHKFKIAGVVVAEGEDKNYLANLYGSEGSGEFGMNEHNGNTKQAHMVQS